MAEWRAAEYAPPVKRTPADAGWSGVLWIGMLFLAIGNWPAVMLAGLSFALPFIYVWAKRRRNLDAVADELERIRIYRLQRTVAAAPDGQNG